MRRLWERRANRRKTRRRQSIRNRSGLAPPVPVPRPKGFEVLCRIDAYADYLALVEAENAQEAAELAHDDHCAFKWESQGVVEFDSRYYVAIDAEGCEIESTIVGDR
jgi:hypothetical protein